MNASTIIQFVASCFIIGLLLGIASKISTPDTSSLHRVADLERQLNESNESLKRMRQLNIELWLRYCNETKAKP